MAWKKIEDGIEGTANDVVLIATATEVLGVLTASDENLVRIGEMAYFLDGAHPPIWWMVVEPLPKP